MTASTHRAVLALELYAVDDQHAREITDMAAASVAPLAGVLAIHASTDPHDSPALSTAEAEIAGAVLRAYLQLHDTLAELGIAPALSHRNRLEELADRLAGDEEMQPVPGEVYALHRGSRA